MKIALTGNPNSGKTTLFNALTGKTAQVGNWAGVTVDKTESEVKKSFSNGISITAIDLPGAYSISPFTSEESITRDYIVNENPDVIINIVDTTNLSRSLFFTTQLLELGIPVVVALNKSDLNEKKHIKIDTDKLSKILSCPVVTTISTSSSDNGLEKLIKVCTLEQNNPVLKGVIAGQSSIKTDKERFDFVKQIIASVEKRKFKSNQKNKQDSMDRIIAHKWLGIPIFALVMWLVFSISQTYIGPLVSGVLVGWIESLQSWVTVSLENMNAAPILVALLADGIVGGVGAVVGFLPLIMVMFFLLALLEDCGYMARVTVVMDRFFKKVGLSGKSIIPMIVGTACAIPGVMATRTIKNERERRTTAMLAPFMPCGAKLPVIALFAGAFFNDSTWVGTLMYFVGIVIIILGASIIYKITGHKAERSFFIMELPEYRFPSIKRATVSMLMRGKAFVVKAGTIILLCNAVIQIMQSFDWQFNVVAQGAQDTSILASIASPFAVLLIPLGFGAWQLAAAAITGFIAKENVVGTLAVVYSITNFINTDELALVAGNEASIAATMGLTSVAALSYLMFNLFTPPCFAAIGAMNAEMESKKWLYSGIALQFGTGYVVAFLVYQIGTLITTGSVGAGFIYGLIAVSVMIGSVCVLMIKARKKEKVKG